MFRLAPFALLAACATPTSGDYTFTYDGDVTTDCSASTDTGDTGDTTNDETTQTVTVADDGSTVTFGTGPASLECPLDGNAFTCEASSSTDYNETTGIDAVVTITASTEGAWKSSSTIKGTISGGTSCAGDGCADIEAMGFEFCSSSQDFEATLVK